MGIYALSYVSKPSDRQTIIYMQFKYRLVYDVLRFWFQLSCLFGIGNFFMFFPLF